MRVILFILFLSSAKLFSQVSAPLLKCLQVLPNGDIGLTWIPAVNTGSTFTAYEIFSSISSAGPYNSIAVIPLISANSFTHTGAGGNIQSRYYYIISKYGSGGTSLSPSSDTLRSIFLNVVSAIPDLKLQYNNIHQPKLNSSASTFTINKEYPLGIWNIFGTSSQINYADTLSVCSASINYQITLKDNSGCVSTSNLQGGVYTDKKSPNTPFIDSISVLPNGQTVVAWQIPRDLDIVKYRIYQSISGINTAIDSVNGRVSTLYTFTTSIATFSPLSIYVAALDSCKKLGGFDIQPTTMFLKKIYDKCGYKTDLSWNAYKGMKGGVLEYRIYYSVNGGAFLNIGSTTQTSFTHNNVPPGQNVCYFIRVINTAKNITASSNRVCFLTNQVPAAGFVYIRNATVVSNTQNLVTVFMDTSKASVGLDIWRSTNGINYTNIGFVPYAGTPYYSFTDDNADSKNYSYYYKAIVRDSCGNSRTVSNITKTIHLKVKADTEQIFTRYLSWTDYKGYIGGVSGYSIYRIINKVKSVTPIGFTATGDTLFTDVLEEEAPNGSDIGYLVEAVEGLGDTYGFLERSTSNTVPVYIEGKLFVPNAFTPKGKNRIWLPVTHFIDKTEYSVSVFNRWGSKVFEANDDTKGWDGANATPDVYVYLIRYKNSRGEYQEVKGSVYLLE